MRPPCAGICVFYEGASTVIEFDSLQHFLTFVRKKKWYTHEKEEEWRGNPRSTALTFGSFSGVMAYTLVTSTPSSPVAG